jgi:branched-chain amino acid transport system ATP-binding protein
MPTYPEFSRPEPHLTVESLAAGYGGSPVVTDLSLTVGRGEVVAVLGPNGSGKSTLVKAVVGQLPVMNGRVLVKGRDITNLPPEVLAADGIGYVPQEKDVFPPLTVQENLQMGGYLLPRRRVRGRVAEVLDHFPKLVPLRNTPAGSLSGGERKLVAMARVLMLEPELMALDEPTANLSPAATRSVLVEQVRRLADNGTAILLVEQKASQALEVSDFGYIFVAGRVQMADAATTLAGRADIGELFLGKAAAAN